MSNSTVYSVGHGTKKIDDFISELKAYEIEFLLDIRSKPFSKWSPQYNRPSLEPELQKRGIKYVFVGDNLGGLPNDRSCYDEAGKVVYDIMREKDFFKVGLNRLIKANAKKIKIAIMCSESKPEECHRSKLIGQELLKNKISLNHILSTKKIKSQEAVMLELTKGRGPVDLFGNELDFRSRKSY